MDATNPTKGFNFKVEGLERFDIARELRIGEQSFYGFKQIAGIQLNDVMDEALAEQLGKVEINIPGGTLTAKYFEDVRPCLEDVSPVSFAHVWETLRRGGWDLEHLDEKLFFAYLGKDEQRVILSARLGWFDVDMGPMYQAWNFYLEKWKGNWSGMVLSLK